jgi:hypothetical protein
MGGQFGGSRAADTNTQPAAMAKDYAYLFELQLKT